MPRRALPTRPLPGDDPHPPLARTHQVIGACERRVAEEASRRSGGRPWRPTTSSTRQHCKSTNGAPSGDTHTNRAGEQFPGLNQEMLKSVEVSREAVVQLRWWRK